MERNWFGRICVVFFLHLVSVLGSGPPIFFNSLAFLDIKLSANDNGLSTSVHYKPTDSHNYVLNSSSHPQQVKNASPFSQFLRLRRLCSEDSDFNNKCEEMCQFFKKRAYPDAAVTTGKHRAQEIDRETALQKSQNEEKNRIGPLQLTVT